MVTQKQIADLLGLSQSTVANILRGAATPKYKEETKKAVLSTAERLGYRPNRSAQAVQRGRSNVIGVLHFASKLEISGKVADRLPDLIRAAGYEPLVVDLRWYSERMERMVQEMVNARVEGVIVAHISKSFQLSHAEALAAARIPAVTVFGDTRLHIPVIRDDVYPAFFELSEHLLGLGHRKVIAVLGLSDSSPMRDRRRAVEEAFGRGTPVRVLEADALLRLKGKVFHAPADVPEAVIVKVPREADDSTYRTSVYHFAQRLFENGVRPDAMICSNDNAAIGVFCAAYERGIRVPADLALTGCDDDAIGELPIFDLTTVRKNITSACKLAVELLLDQIRGGEGRVVEHLLPSEVVYRSSCGQLLFRKEESQLLRT